MNPKGDLVDQIDARVYDADLGAFTAIAGLACEAGRRLLDLSQGDLASQASSYTEEGYSRDRLANVELFRAHQTPKTVAPVFTALALVAWGRKGEREDAWFDGDELEDLAYSSAIEAVEEMRSLADQRHPDVADHIAHIVAHTIAQEVLRPEQVRLHIVERALSRLDPPDGSETTAGESAQPGKVNLRTAGQETQRTSSSTSQEQGASLKRETDESAMSLTPSDVLELVQQDYPPAEAFEVARAVFSAATALQQQRSADEEAAAARQRADHARQEVQAATNESVRAMTTRMSESQAREYLQSLLEWLDPNRHTN